MRYFMVQIFLPVQKELQISHIDFLSERNEVILVTFNISNLLQTTSNKIRNIHRHQIPVTIAVLNLPSTGFPT